MNSVITECMPTIGVFVKKRHYDILHDMAKERGVGVSTLVREIIEEYLNGSSVRRGRYVKTAWKT